MQQGNTTPCNLYVVIAQKLVNHKTQTQIAKELKLNKSTVSRYAKRLEDKEVIIKAVRSARNFYIEGPNFQSFVEVAGGSSGGLDSLQLSPKKKPQKGRPESPPENGIRPHRMALKFKVMDGPNPEDLKKYNWKVTPYSYGGHCASLKGKEWSFCWYHGKEKSTMMIWPDPSIIYQATTEVDVIASTDDYKARGYQGANWLQRYMKFTLAAPKKKSEDWEIGFALENPEVEAFVKRNGMITIIRSNNPEPIIMDYSKDEDKVMYWGTGEIETGLQTALTWIAAAEAYPELKKDMEAMKKLFKPSDDIGSLYQ